jgi:hypothetical protein
VGKEALFSTDRCSLKYFAMTPIFDGEAQNWLKPSNKIYFIQTLPKKNFLSPILLHKKYE